MPIITCIHTFPIYTYKTWILFAGMFVHIFRSHQNSQRHQILAIGLIWANLKLSPIFEILFFKGGPHMVQGPH